MVSSDAAAVRPARTALLLDEEGVTAAASITDFPSESTFDAGVSEADATGLKQACQMHDSSTPPS